MATQTFTLGGMKYKPVEKVTYNGKPGAIWERWMWLADSRAWCYAGRAHLKANSTRAQVIAIFAD
jgi:hypothetical protein